MSKPSHAFALLAVVQVTLTASITILLVALPAVGADLRLSDGDLVLATSGFGVAYGGLLLVGGRLADRFGHRRVLLVGILVFGTASLGVATAAGPVVLVVTRVAQGAGAALVAPSAMALLASIYPAPDERSGALARWGVLPSVGASAGTVLSGLLLTWVTWRWLFVFPVLVAVWLLSVGPARLPAGPPPRSRDRNDVVAGVLITAGVGAVILGLATSRPAWLASGVTVLLLLVLVQSRSDHPLVPRGMVVPDRLVALYAIVATAGAMTTCLFLLTLFLQQIRGLTPLATSMAFVPGVAALLIAAALGGRAQRRLGSATLATLGLLLSAGGLVVLVGLDASAAHLAVPVVGLAVFCLGAGFTFSSATVMAASDVASTRAGIAGGLTNTAMELGPPLGLSLLVALASARTAAIGGQDLVRASVQGYRSAFVAGACALVVAAALMVRQRANAAPRRSDTSTTRRGSCSPTG